jgi:hypothetical protein
MPRVVVHFAHGRDDLIYRFLGQPEIAGGIAFGEASVEGITQLRQAGMLVEPAGETEDEPAPPSRQAVSLLGVRNALSALLRATPLRSVDVFVLSLAGPLLPDWREALESRDVTLLARYGGRRFTTRMGLGQLREIHELHFVERIRPYALADTVDLSQFLELDGESILFELIVHRAADAEVLLGALPEMGVGSM